jgi:hypothetical protein
VPDWLKDDREAAQGGSWRLRYRSCLTTVCRAASAARGRRLVNSGDFAVHFAVDFTAAAGDCSDCVGRQCVRRRGEGLGTVAAGDRGWRRTASRPCARDRRWCARLHRRLRGEIPWLLGCPGYFGCPDRPPGCLDWRRRRRRSATAEAEELMGASRRAGWRGVSRGTSPGVTPAVERRRLPAEAAHGPLLRAAAEDRPSVCAIPRAALAATSATAASRRDWSCSGPAYSCSHAAPKAESCSHAARVRGSGLQGARRRRPRRRRTTRGCPVRPPGAAAGRRRRRAQGGPPPRLSTGRAVGPACSLGAGPGSGSRHGREKATVEADEETDRRGFGEWPLRVFQPTGRRGTSRGTRRRGTRRGAMRTT